MRGADSWTTARRVLDLSGFFTAGVVNATPDSFYDGGRHLDPDAAAAHALELAEAGADILDVGGESTRPGARPVTAEEESRRVLPVIRRTAQVLAQRRSTVAISVDTYKASVAAAALDAGAEIVNDVSACRFDPQLAGVLADQKPGYVLMHSLGRPETMQDQPAYQDVVGEILDFFEQRLAFLVRAGLPEDRIVLDPGVGFGKTLEHNLDILRGVERLHALGRPLFVGLSRKSLWKKLLGLDPADSLVPTCAATALLAERGVLVHRVHDAAPARQTLQTVRAMAERAYPEASTPAV